jgi:hypothetical protein
MKTKIRDAINKRKVLLIQYNGGFRYIEPFCYGKGISGKELLRAYQIKGFSEFYSISPWRIFKIAGITHLSIVPNSHFNTTRHGYEPNDPAMIEIYCRV